MVIIESLYKKITNGDVDYNYSYRLLKGQISVSMYGKLAEIQAYGIEIERQDVIDGTVVGIQRDCVENISPERYKVKKLLNMVYDNEVSPIHMIDVLGEYIDDYTSDFDEILVSTATC